MPQQYIRLALQRSGRLAEGSQSLLTKCGINVIALKNQLLVQDHEFGMEFIFVRDDDIPGLVQKGVCDLGIIGSNLMDEYCGDDQSACNQLEVVMKLGFARCKLSLAIMKDQLFESVQDLEGKVIATSYPNTLRRFLMNNQINANIVTMHGSVELAPQMGIADVICDLVSSGATLKENGLQECMKIIDSEAILIANKMNMNAEKKLLLERLMLRINGLIMADKNKYVMLHIEREKLDLIKSILPGSESPTVVDLQSMPGRVAVHVVSHEHVFWNTIEKLKSIGARSILVLPIEKMIG